MRMRTHDELTRGAATRAKQTEVQRAADENAEPELLRLQRSSGNEAVTQLVQRDRAASTDAPWAKKRKKPAKPKHTEPIHARIIGISIVNGMKDKGYDFDEMTQIMIAVASEKDAEAGHRPVWEGMKGSVDGPHGADFTVEELKNRGRVAIAYVHMTPDMINWSGSMVTIDPNSAGPDPLTLGD